MGKISNPSRPGPASSKPGPSSSKPGPSSSKAGPSSSQTRPSSKPGPASSKKKGTMNGTRSNGRAEEESEEDADMEVEQSDADRRAIRNQYRNLIYDIKDKQLEYSDPKSDKLTDTLETANRIFHRVNKTREGALDSQLLVSIAQCGRQKAQRLHTDFLVFNPKNFILKAASEISTQTLEGIGDDDNEGHTIRQEQWEEFGAKSQYLFKTSPCLQFMFGAFEREPAAPRPRKERRAKEKETDDKTKIKQPEMLKDANTEGATSSEVEKIYKLLHQETKPDPGDKTPRPMCYFDFVVNPESFTQTVENIFYTSFLVKDGHAKISLDEDKLPVIESIERPKEGTQQARDQREKIQVVMPFTMKEWKEIVETYGITEPTIPTRPKVNLLKRKSQK